MQYITTEYIFGMFVIVAIAFLLCDYLYEKRRMLIATWTVELETDLKSIFGLDCEKELTKIAIEKLNKEIKLAM